MSNSATLAIATLTALLTLPGCGAQDDTGPPEIRYGDTLCAYCGMIISDERFATATVIKDDRGDTPLVFDDFSCQLNYEAEHPDLAVVTRWSHDHASSQWKPTAELWFVRSDQLRTPMASHMAAFSTQADAEAFAKPIDGKTISADALWPQRDPSKAP